MKNTIALLGGLLLLTLLMPTAFAQSLSFTYQGQLLNSGEPFSGTADLEFELFVDVGEVFSMGTDSHPGHPVSNGLFQVYLSFELVAPASERGMSDPHFPPMFLAVTVDGQQISPLQPITPAPMASSALYALNSYFAETAGAPWQINGDDIQYLDGRVGIGRAPSDFMVIDSGLEEQDEDYSFGTGVLRVMIDGATKFRVLGNGGVAIGSSYNGSGVPVDGLRVAGGARFENTATFNGLFQVNGISTFTGQLTAQNTAFFSAPTVGANFLTPVIMQALPGGGNTDLCRNTQNFVSTCSSSARYKNDIVNLDNASNLIDALRPVSYRWIESGELEIGLVAEEVAAQEPRLATYRSDGEVEGVKYRQLTAVLVRALQEQRQENNAALAVRDAEIAALRVELAEQRRETSQRLVALERLLGGDTQLAEYQP